MPATDIFQYRHPTADDATLTGYGVEAIDGHIGKVDEASNEVGRTTSLSTPARGSSGRRYCCPRV